MLWFDGPIRKAVDTVKSSGAFLLVFVQGEDELSKKYETYLSKEAKFTADDYVALKIPHDSVALQQFKQIYVSVPIPSIFLLQNNGVPLKVVSTKETSDIHSEIIDTLNQKKIGKEKKNNVQTNKELCNQMDNQSSEGAASKPLLRVRNIGRRISDISKEEIQKRLSEIRAFPRFWLIEPSMSESSPCHSRSCIRETSARIQFRLPNDTMPSWEFPEKATLRDVKAYLTEKMKLKSNFRLLRTYPRCAFGPEDEGRTLGDLALTPSATLIVIPVEDKTVQAKVRNMIAQPSFFSQILNTLLWPLYRFLRFFKKNIYGSTKEEQQPQRLPSDTAFEKVFNKKTSTSNIHGFKFDEEPDSDTEHPDNGNSTQQRFQK